MSKGRQSRPLFFISAKDCPKSIAKFSLIWYDINIFYTSSKLEQIQFTGELIRYKNIEELLSKFEILEKVKFEIRNNTVTIKEYKKGRDCW